MTSTYFEKRYGWMKVGAVFGDSTLAPSCRPHYPFYANSRLPLRPSLPALALIAFHRSSHRMQSPSIVVRIISNGPLSLPVATRFIFRFVAFLLPFPILDVS